jgi:hypothetical protein
LTCTQSFGFFGFGLADGVGVGLLVGVGVGVGVLVGVGVGLGVELVLGDGLCVGVGVGDGAGVVLDAALALGVGVDVAAGASDAEGLAAAGDDELRVKTAARLTAIGCRWRANALTVAGRLAHVPAVLALAEFLLAEFVPADLMRASPYARAIAEWWEAPLPTMNSPAMRPKTVMPKATNRARRKITDTLFPPCRPARGYRPSPP